MKQPDEGISPDSIADVEAIVNKWFPKDASARQRRACVNACNEVLERALYVYNQLLKQVLSK